MKRVTYSSDAACLLRGANFKPSNVATALKDFDWDQIFSEAENTDAITRRLQELCPEEPRHTIEFFADVIMNGCGSLSVTSTSTNKKTEVEKLRPYKNERTLEHYRRVATDKKNEYVSNVLRCSSEIASSQTV